MAGMQLSEAMARRPDIFPSDYRAILAGETGGATGRFSPKSPSYLARRLEIHNGILTALIYPAVLVVMSMVLLRPSSCSSGRASHRSLSMPICRSRAFSAVCPIYRTIGSSCF